MHLNEGLTNPLNKPMMGRTTKEAGMRTWEVRVRGTINDVVIVEADSAEDAHTQALLEWRYVEYEDLEAEVEDEIVDDD